MAAKLLNYLVVFLLLVSVILRFIQFRSESDPFFFLLTFYLLFFAVLLVIAELKIKRIIVFVEFLNGRIGKGVFILFVGLLLFDESRKVDMFIAMFIVLIAFFNIMVSCMRKPKEYKEESLGGNTEELESDKRND